MTNTELGELTYHRAWNAPRALVFECMTTPEHLTHFWGPVGVSAPVDRIVVDLRPGGVFETVMVNDADGTEYPTRGVFVEVVVNELLTWTEADVEGGMITSIVFRDGPDGTCITDTHQTNVPEHFRSADAQAGMESSFQRMDAYLSTLLTP